MKRSEIQNIEKRDTSNARENDTNKQQKLLEDFDKLLALKKCDSSRFCKRCIEKAKRCPKQLLEKFRGDSFFPRGVAFFRESFPHKIKLMIVADNPGPKLKGEKERFKDLNEYLDDSINSYYVKGRTSFSRILKNLIMFLKDNYNIEEKEIYLTQMVKCGGFPSTEVPLAIRKHCFKKWLSREIEIIKPKIIICLGKNVYTGLYYVLEDDIIKRTHLLQTYHPSYLARLKKQKCEEILERLIEDNEKIFKRVL